MKKFTLLFFAAVLATTVAFGQTAFWSETFGSGIPAGWTNAGSSNGGPTLTGMWKYTKTGSHGLYSGGLVLKSPTGGTATAAANNGYVIFDSDSLDSGGTGGAQGSGPAPSPQRGYLTTSSINCSGHSRVYLSFYQLYLGFDAKSRVVIDNGTSSDTIEVNENLDYAGAITTNPSLQHFDITALAANQANVKITFLWEGEYYFWMVDDISLLDAPANDLKLTSAATYSYYTYPLSQIDTVYYSGTAINQGTVDQTNTRLKATIKKGNVVLFSDTSALGVTLPYNVDSPIVGANVWAPVNPLTGAYTSIVSTFSDSVDAFTFDNADTSVFNINDSVYAVENGQEAGAFYVIGNGNNIEWVNLFEVRATDTITSITTSLAGGTGGTDVGAVIQGKVYSLDPSTFAATNIISTEQRTLAAADLPANGYTIKNINMRIDIRSGTAGAAILQPGLYAVSLVGVSAPNQIVIHSCTKKAPGSLSGQFDVNSTNGTPFSFYRNTNMYIRANFGHKLNMLTCSYTRTPGGASVKQNVPITFNGTSNGTAGVAIYTWTFDNGQGTVDTVSGTAASTSYTFVNTGTYTVCLTVTENGYTAVTCKTITVVINGINDIEELANISMMPNPTSGNVTIKAEDVNGAVKIQMFNILGSEVKEFNETANGTFAKQFNISDLASGNYIVRIQNGDRMTTRRLTVSK